MCSTTAASSIPVRRPSSPPTRRGSRRSPAQARKNGPTLEMRNSAAKSAGPLAPPRVRIPHSPPIGIDFPSISSVKFLQPLILSCCICPLGGRCRRQHHDPLGSPWRPLSETRGLESHIFGRNLTSTTIPSAEAILQKLRQPKKGKGKEAKLAYTGNVMTENRNGFVVEAE